MKDLITRITRHPVVAHIMAAVNRYNKRLGPQFAAAVTYFSVLSIVPILLFGVSVLGFTLTVLRPEWFEVIKTTIEGQLGDSDLAGSVNEVLEEAFDNWRGTTLVALLTAGYSGSKWIGNLKKAFRAMWRDRFIEASETKNFFIELLENLAIFLGLLASVLLAFGVTAAGSGFSEEIIGWLGLEDVPGISLLLRLVSIGLTLVASWLLFAFLFWVLPGERTNWRTWLIGTLSGAVLVTLLQQLGGLLVGAFRGNAAASVFGPVIVLMLVLNLLATIILMVAGWVGTADTWEHDRLQQDADKAAEGEDAAEAVEDDHHVRRPDEFEEPSWRVRDEQRRLRRAAGQKSLEELRAATFDPDNPPVLGDDRPVPQDVARRSVKVGSTVGYGLGAATGLGAGAFLAWLVGKLLRRG